MATAVHEQLQPSDPSHPEYGLKPTSKLDAVDGNKTTAVGTSIAPSSVPMDSDSNVVTNPGAVPEASDTVVESRAAAPSACTESNSNGTSAFDFAS